MSFAAVLAIALIIWLFLVALILLFFHAASGASAEYRDDEWRD